MTDDDKNWLAVPHAIADSLCRRASELEGLAKAFARTGNETVAEELRWMADGMRNDATALDTAVHAKVQEDLHHSQSMAGGILAGILGGVIRPKEQA